MTYADAVSQLDIALAGDLPGARAQAQLSPRPRRQWPPSVNPARIRLAAGLVLVHPSSSIAIGDADAPAQASHTTAQIVLTVRADSVRRHAGQVSLPGGVLDPGETFEQAALREAHEEVALDPTGVRVLGALTPLDIPVSGFRLHPIVATLPHVPMLRPSDHEVARIIHADLDDLLAPSSIVTTTRTREGVVFDVPAFHVEGVEIWGATAMVLAELLTLLGWEPA